MLYAFGFERVCVVAGDLYFVNPDPSPGQEGAERGVRVELRMLSRGELKGSIYSAQPIEVDRPIWRVDLLEQASGPVGTFDRTHHHPAFDGWNPCPRVFDKELSARPLEWLGERLADLGDILERAGVAKDEVAPSDAGRVRDRAPEIVAAVDRLLEGVRAGELAQPPGDGPLTEARAGWL